MPTVFSYYDAGMASAFLSMAAYNLGYRTHFFGTMDGSSVGQNPGTYAYGKPKADIDALSAVTKHGRPNSFAMWEPNATTPPLIK